MGETVESKRTVFVTVGTTCFDSLVRAVDAQDVKEALYKKGYSHLLIQMGRGSYVPVKSAGEGSSLSVDYFTFSSSIAEYLKAASLVISHAGSGSIFETLRLGKPLIVVVNEDLMDNHQSELAEELAERKHLFCACPQTLYELISTMDLDSLVAYQPGDATLVAKFFWDNDQHLEEPQPNNLQSTSAGNDGVRRWKKLYIGVLHCGIFQIARGIQKIAFFKVGFWSFVLATGGVAAVVLASLLHRGVLTWKSKESLMRLIKEKDKKINQLLLHLAQMNEILQARRRVPVLRVK